MQEEKNFCRKEKELLMTLADYIYTERGEGPRDGRRGSQKPTLGIHLGGPDLSCFGQSIPDNNECHSHVNNGLFYKRD